MTQNKAPEQGGEFFLPPDNSEVCWEVGSLTFTRKEVFSLLWTQRSMIVNDIKREVSLDGQEILLEILNNPRIPIF